MAILSLLLGHSPTSKASTSSASPNNNENLYYYPCFEYTFGHASHLMDRLASCGSSEAVVEVPKSPASPSKPSTPEMEVLSTEELPRNPLTSNRPAFIPCRSVPSGTWRVSWVSQTHRIGSYTAEQWRGTLLLSSGDGDRHVSRHVGWIDTTAIPAGLSPERLRSTDPGAARCLRRAMNNANCRGELSASRLILLQNILVAPEYQGLGLALYMVDQACEVALASAAEVLLDATGHDIPDASVSASPSMTRPVLTKSSSLSRLRNRSFRKQTSMEVVRQQLQRERSLPEAPTPSADVCAYYQYVQFNALPNDTTLLRRSERVDIHTVCPHLFE